MKKWQLLVILLLISSTLACRLTFFNRWTDTPVRISQTPVVAKTDLEVPTATPTPLDDSQVRGWATFSENGVAINLPDTYVLGDIDTQFETMLQGVSGISEEGANYLAQLYEDNKENIILWGYDTDTTITWQSSVLVIKNDELVGLPLTVVSSAANLIIGEGAQAIAQTRLTLGNWEVLRLMTTVDIGGNKTTQAIYLLQGSSSLWLIGFFTDQEDISAQLRVFDGAVASFKISEGE